ncbi:DoxX family membrane protein [Candidatus Parcubacteria bacterium]|nr:DoxX family membrane protein [Candidatus Parcubacteria bacterium]
MHASKANKLVLILLRISVGWFFLYEGIISILDSQWTLLPFIKDARTFPEFYSYISQPELLPYLSFIAKGLFILIGALLIAGFFVRLGAFLGILLMLFFYFPLLSFPYVHPSHYIVDYHFVMIMVLLHLFVARAGEVFGLGSMFHFSRY